MRIFSFRKIRRLFSFASMGISRSSGRGVRRRNAFKQRRDAFSAWRLNSEQLEPKKMLAVGAPGIPSAPATTGGLNAAEEAAGFNVTVSFNGQAEENDALTLKTDGNNVVASAVVTAADKTAGQITFNVKQNELGGIDGNRILNATLTTAGGGPSHTSGDLTFLMDTDPPDAPTVIPQITNNPVGGIAVTGTTGDGQPLPAGETLKVTVNGVPETFNTGTTAGGNWQTTKPLNLANDGTYQVTATVSDAVGNAVTDGSSNELIVDRTNPSVNSINGPANQNLGVGQTINFQLNHDAIALPVVGAAPAITFNLAGNNRTAAYQAVLSTGTQSVFQYAVQPADNNANFINNVAFIPGAAQDTAGNGLINPVAFAGQYNMNIQTGAINAPTFTNPANVAATPIAVPVPLVLINFPAGVTVAENTAGAVGLDDFQLTRDGVVLPLTGDFNFNSFNPSPTQFTISDLEGLTNEPGQYVMTFADIGVANAPAQVTWIKGLPTADELTATVSPFLGDGTAATGAAFETVSPELAVEYVDIEFNNQVQGVNTEVQGPAIQQFRIFRDGQSINNNLSNTVQVSQISDTAYRISGLSADTNTAGDYQVLVGPDSLISTYNSDTTVVPGVQPGAPLRAVYGASWDKHDQTTATVTLPNHLLTTYSVGEPLRFTAVFSEIVTVPGAASINFTIDRATSPNTPNKAATYVSGSGTDTLIFEYEVDDGDFSEGIVAGTAFTGVITDENGLQVVPAFTSTGNASLIDIDGEIPTIVSAVGPPPGSYDGTAPNNDLDITLSLSEPVVVTGSPNIPLTIGGRVRNAVMVASPNPNTLVFRYPIASATDVFAYGSFTVGDINLNGGTIRDVAGNDADLVYPAGQPVISDVMINRTEPTVAVTRGQGTAPSTVVENKTGDVIEFTATYPQAVTVDDTTGVPSIAINVDNTVRQATYVAGSGTTDIRFQYVVPAADEDDDGISFQAAEINLNGGSMIDAAGAVETTFPTPQSLLNVLDVTNVDGEVPTIASAVGPTPGSYDGTAPNNTLDITLNFDETVTLSNASSSPAVRLPLTIGGQLREAEYLSGSGTSSTLVFRYTIASATDVYANGSFTVGALNLNGETIRDAAGNDANLAFTPPTITGVSINELTPTVTVTSNTPYNYDVNQVIEFTAAFTAAVDVTGTPTIDILVGGTTRSADYVAGSGTQNLKFRYTVQNGDIDEDGIEIPAAIISLSPTASITSVDGGVDIDPAFTPPTTSGIKVGLPRVTRIITTTPDGSYDTGAIIDITMTTSLPVRVTDAANTKLYLNTSDGSPNTVVTDDAGETDSSTSVTLSIDASVLSEGMVVTDSEGDIPLGTQIEGITLGTNGNPDTITLTQAATGSTTPNTLTFTGVSPNADYAIFLGDSNAYTTSLQFQYIVQDADSSEDLDYFDTASLKFPADSIQTAGGITLDENLQVPGTFNSIAFNSNVVVNTTPPQVESFSTINPDGKYGTDQTIGIRATLSEAITAGHEFKIRLDTGAEVTLTTDGTERASGVYTIEAGETTPSLKVIDILPETLTDAASNTLLTMLPSSITIGSIEVDTKTPLITQFSVTKIDGNSVTGPTTGTYGVGTTFTLTATTDETIRIGSSIKATLNNGQVATLSAAAAGTTLEGTYTVGAQDNSSTDLTVTSFTKIALRDVAGNEITDFTVPGYPNNIGSLNSLTVDTEAPNITSFTAEDGTYKENDEIEITATLSEPIAGSVVTETGATVLDSTSVTSIDASDLFEGMVVTDSEGDIPPGTQILEITDGGIGAVDTITLTQAATGSTPTNTLTFTGSTFSVELNSGGSVTLIVQDGESTATGKYTVGSSDTASALTVNQILPGDVVDFGNNPLFTVIPPGQNLGDNAAIIIDNTPPEIQLLQSNVEKVNAIETATLSIVLSEPSDDFAFANLNPTNGTLDAASFSGSEANYSVDFVPTADIDETTATITVVGSFTDRAGNTYVDTGVSETIQVDTKAPTIQDDVPNSILSTGQTQTINFTLSEESTDFDDSDLTETNGLLSPLSGSGSSYSAIFTPAANFEGIGVVTIAGGVLTDSFGNPNASTDVSINIDTKAPTLTITSPPGILGGNDGNGVPPATVTFSFDEDVTGFELTDIAVTAGTGLLSDFDGTGSSYTATFTPAAGINDTATISFIGEVTDLNGNSTTTATPESITINTVRPTVDIDGPTTVVNGPTTVTFTLSANSTDFTDLNVVTVTGGTLGTVTGSDSSYTAIFTPSPNSTTSGQISVADDAFTDTDGNTNTASATTTILVDTVAPSAPTLSLSASADSPVSKAEATSAFGIVDVTGEAGAAINILFTGSNGNSITKSATGSSDSIQLTEGDLNTLGDGAVAVTATQTDTAGNESPVSSPLEFVLDTIAPQVVAVDSSSPPGAYKSGETVTINAYLSEPVAAGQNFFMALNTSSLIVLTTAGGGLTLTGTYTVSGTANADPLAITAILNDTVNPVADTSGNPLSTDLPQQVTFDGIEIDTIAPQPATLSLVATEPVSAAEAVATSGFATVQGEAGASIAVTITGTNNQNDPITRNLLGTGSAQALSLAEADLTTLGEGLVTLTAVQTDAAGNRQATPDDEKFFTLDTTPPSQFNLLPGTNIDDGATATEATQATGLVRFTAEAGSSITVTVTDSAGTQHVLNPIIGTGSEQAVRATIADLSVLADGLLVISAVQTDAAGNTQIIPSELTVVLDQVAPNAPNLTIRDNVSSPFTLAEITDTNGVINVLGEDGADIVVLFIGQNGGFPKNLTGTGFNQPIALDATEAAILGEGSIAITATQTDAAGNTSTQETLSVVIDLTAPEVLALELDADPDFYGEDDSIPLSGELSEPANAGQILRVVLNVLEADGVTPVVVDVTVAANGTDLAGAYVVQAGHNKDDLSINSFTNDHPSNPVTDVAGNPLLDSSSNSSSNQKSSASSSGFVGGQSSGIVVDTVAPEVIEWITTEGTYVVDDTVMIQLRVNEPAAAGSTINVRTNTLGIFRQDIVLNLDANDPTLFTGQYTVALGERADELVLSVASANTTDRAGNSLNLGSITSGNQSGRVIRGSISLGDSENGMQWGPDHEDGSPSVLINLSTGVTGLDIGAITLNINGRTISLRDASVSQTSSTNYILRLPQRVASLGGGFTITIWSSDIRSILDPDVGMDDAIEFTLPDAGMNTDSETGSR